METEPEKNLKSSKKKSVKEDESTTRTDLMKKILDMLPTEDERDHALLDHALEESKPQQKFDIMEDVDLDENLIKDLSPIRSSRLKYVPTCVSVDIHGTFALVGLKSCGFGVYDIETGKMIITRGREKRASSSPGHFKPVISCCIGFPAPSSFPLLITGSSDRTIRIWDSRDKREIAVLTGHRGAVTGVVCAGGGREVSKGDISEEGEEDVGLKSVLVSCSEDRTLKTWNLEMLTYIDTSYGHTSQVTAIDSLTLSRCVTCSDDLTVRNWKIWDASQTVHSATREGKGKYAETIGSFDALKMFDPTRFVTGGEDGAVMLWSSTKRSPRLIIPNAHGTAYSPHSSLMSQPSSTLSSSSSSSQNIQNNSSFISNAFQPTLHSLHVTPHSSYVSSVSAAMQSATAAGCNWISSVATIPYSNTFATGSCNGAVKLWKITRKTMDEAANVANIAETGFVNGMAFVGSCVSPLPPKTHGGKQHKWDENEEEEISKEEEDKRMQKLQRMEKAYQSRWNVSDLKLITVVGQEHRLGRWMRIKEAKNSLHVFSLSSIKSDEKKSNDEDESEDL
ncbi:putative nucleic acid binding protein [Monocercomonoides exilis]|uniref:putative nucleic acid binding protein n=1 Tax=Monocercomonoides exilis TaxID=2049356 RepID=UPI00355973B7|nr:putative nucleic acid binding protein [Monocercomonoides exilis]|eukprot:MONOS_9085.1-p1 / transcript=MONOS_9085.1 / gene=MONOS_9085 / organism=Monocercomonoides_exilis_PA203 / gene_product=nucleic acid binding protein / transcript_product=nucleic acid binding protein / location=Mono_scaffold00363:49993-52077(+) / protein_length=563 / sequence_SO=supercontig / SO=protein_coding / is_pseudo=false